MINHFKSEWSKWSNKERKFFLLGCASVLIFVALISAFLSYEFSVIEQKNNIKISNLILVELSYFDLRASEIPNVFFNAVFVLSIVLFIIFCILIFQLATPQAIACLFLLIVTIFIPIAGDNIKQKVISFNEIELSIDNYDESVSKSKVHEEVLRRLENCNTTNSKCILQTRRWAVSSGYEYDFEIIMKDAKILQFHVSKN